MQLHGDAGEITPHERRPKRERVKSHEATFLSLVYDLHASILAASVGRVKCYF